MKPVPSAAKYQAALVRLLDAGIPPSHLAMLKAHRAAGQRGLTATQLGKAAGYRKDPGASANLQYGTFARRLAGELGVDPSTHVAVIETWDHDVRNKRGHLLFPMRPQLAQALESLGLVKRSPGPATPKTVSAEDTLDDEELAAFEGSARRQMVQHRHREASLRAAKLAAVLAASHDGRLRCEVPGCGFDFEEVYGGVGRRYAQVHHLRPLGARRGATKTRLRDLAVVCANCHAMIHRGGTTRPLKGLMKRQMRPGG